MQHARVGLVLADCHENPVMPCGNKSYVGKQEDLIIFDCDLLLDASLREAGYIQINPVLLFVLAVRLGFLHLYETGHGCL